MSSGRKEASELKLSLEKVEDEVKEKTNKILELDLKLKTTQDQKQASDIFLNNRYKSIIFKIILLTMI